MGQFLKSERLKVALGLIIGLVLIMILNPPHTVCDSKIEVYSELIKKQIKPYSKAMALCKEHTELGGCLQFFEVAAKLNNYLDDVGPQCREKLKSNTLTQQWLNGSIEMMVRAAWGSVPPTSSSNKQGWLQLSQMAFFCKLKKALVESFGEGAWVDMVNYLLNDLPKAKELGRNEAWARSIMSDPCNY
ncbi:MAG: hypothetical protein IPM57_11110 [Oligoflexia bacterium]|nr:hypothetical protein [Oligoflexia bacterium]